MDTVKDLVQAFRDDEKDAVAPYFWSDQQLLRWARQAVDRFCEITRSVYDSTSPFTELHFYQGEDAFPRHPCIIDIVRCVDERGRDVEVISPGHDQPSPRSNVSPVLVVDNANLRLVPPPPEEGVINLQVIRRPVRQLGMDSLLTDVPVSEREHLLLFIKHRAYRVNDAEVLDPAKAANYLAEFERACQKYYETASTAAPSRNIRFRW